MTRFVVLAALLLACSPSKELTGDVADDCMSVIQLYCSQGERCFTGAWARGSFSANCYYAPGCTQAVSVSSDGYAACVSSLAEATCTELCPSAAQTTNCGVSTCASPSCVVPPACLNAFGYSP